MLLVNAAENPCIINFYARGALQEEITLRRTDSQEDKKRVSFNRINTIDINTLDVQTSKDEENEQSETSSTSEEQDIAPFDIHGSSLNINKISRENFNPTLKKS